MPEIIIPVVVVAVVVVLALFFGWRILRQSMCENENFYSFLIMLLFILGHSTCRKLNVEVGVKIMALPILLLCCLGIIDVLILIFINADWSFPQNTTTG